MADRNEPIFRPTTPSQSCHSRESAESRDPEPNPNHTPITRNEPNRRTGTACRAPTLRKTKKSKRTQLPPSPRPKRAKHTQFLHTKCPATPYLCETNPIYPTATLPNAPNEPISSLPRWPQVSPDSSGNPIPTHFELATLAEGQSRCTSGNPIAISQNPLRNRQRPPTTSPSPGLNAYSHLSRSPIPPSSTPDDS